MKNTLKRLLSLLLVITMVLSMVPAAFAAEATEETAAAGSTETGDIAPVETGAEETVETTEETAAATETTEETMDAVVETTEAAMEIVEETIAAVENVTEPAEVLLEDIVTDEALDAAAVTGPNMTAAGLKILSKDTIQVAPGVSYEQIISRNSSNQQNIGYLTRVDLNQKVELKAGYKGYYTAGSTSAQRAEAVENKEVEWGFQPITKMASDYASIADPTGTVVMATNADFFNMTTGEPSGYLIMEGNAIRTKNEPYFAILKDGSAVIRDAGTDCSDVVEAISGPYYLVKNGKSVVSGSSSAVPRNSVGICNDGSVVFYLNDGRQEPLSTGMSEAELAAVLLDAGCHTALYLDGGGSATLAARNNGSLEVVNSPSDGFERGVSSAVLIVSTTSATGVFDHAVITPSGKLFNINAKIQFSAAGIDTAGFAVAVPGDTVWALSDDSFGSIDSNGLFAANSKTGKVTIELRRGGVCVGSAEVEIVASAEADHELENAVYDRTTGKVICNSCGASLDPVAVEYTDWARDKETGKRMYLVDGKPQTGEFLFGEDTYYFDENGVGYQGKATLREVELQFENGLLVGGYTGFLKKKDGNTYHYENGKMTRGWLFESENLYHFNTNSGVMTTGTKVLPDEESYSKNAYYDFADDGKVLRSYFNPKGYYYWGGLPKADAWVKNGYDADPVAWYRTNSNGHFVTGGSGETVRIAVDGVEYTFDNSSGKLLEGNVVVNGDETRSYYWAGKPATNGWLKWNGKTIYATKDGTLATGTHVIDGQIYMFDGEGTLVTEGVIMTAVVDKKNTSMTVKISNVEEADEIRLAIWFDNAPQGETLSWYDAVQGEDGKWMLIVPLCGYNKVGKWNIHAYQVVDGKESFLVDTTTQVDEVGHTYDDSYDPVCNVCGNVRATQVPADRDPIDMYRMYNPNSGEHFYTGSEVERDNLVSVGWKYEGVGFTFPKATGRPVYRLYDKYDTYEHLYTMDEAEKEALINEGWVLEGVAFNSAYESEVPQYRLHNPNATIGAYHFTASQIEKNNLIAAGWEYQGIGFYTLGDKNIA